MLRRRLLRSFPVIAIIGIIETSRLSQLRQGGGRLPCENEEIHDKESTVA